MTGSMTFLRDWQQPRRLVIVAMALAMIVAVFVSATSGTVGMASLLWVVCVALFWRQPVLGIAVVAFTIPLQDRMWIETIMGDSTPTRYVSWALIVGFAVTLMNGTRVAIDRVAIMHMLVIVTLVTSFAAGGVRVLSWFYEIYHWLLPLAVYLVCRSLPLTVRSRLLIVAGIAVGITVASTVGVYQLITGAGPESYQVGGAVRVFGTFGHPNTLAAFLVTSLPLVIAVACTRLMTVDPMTRWTIRIGAVAGTMSLMLTQSRGGWLAFGVAAVFLVVMAPRRAQRAIVGGALLIVVIGIATGMATAIPGLERFASVVDSQIGRVQVTTETWGQLEREAHWGAARSMMLDHPLFGVGAGEFNDNFREYTTEWRFRVGRGQAHNGYLHMGAQAGLPGLAAFVAWIGTMLLALWLRMRQSSDVNLVLAVGATGCVIAYVVDSFFEYLGVLSLPVLLAIVIAVGLGGVPHRSSVGRKSVEMSPAGNGS